MSASMDIACRKRDGHNVFQGKGAYGYRARRGGRMSSLKGEKGTGTSLEGKKKREKRVTFAVHDGRRGRSEKEREASSRVMGGRACIVFREKKRCRQREECSLRRLGAFSEGEGGKFPKFRIGGERPSLGDESRERRGEDHSPSDDADLNP